jgi:DNA primase
LLYGFWKTKNAVREANCAVLVEGQMDFLMAHQDGVGNLVATSGTALTDEHLKLIRRLSENLVLSFDNDSAGKAAAERTIDLAAINDLNTKVIIFDDPALKDPADIAKAKPGHFAELIKKAIPAMEYYFIYYGIDSKGDVAFRKKAIRQALAKIKQISSPVEQHQWLSLLAQRASIPENALTAEMATIAIAAKPGAVVAANPVEHIAETPVNRIDRVVRRILSIALNDKVVLQKALDAKLLFPEKYKKILEYVGQSNQGVTVGDSAIPPELLNTVNLMYLESGFDPAPREVDDLFFELDRTGKTIKRKEMQERIRMAEMAHDDGEVARLLEEFGRLDR